MKLIKILENLDIRAYPKKLYHITFVNNWNNGILWDGLIPQKTTRTIHDKKPKIYFIDTDFSWQYLADDLAKYNKEDYALLLKVNLNSLPKNIKFYEDEDSNGYYTYSKIPKSAISHVGSYKINREFDINPFNGKKTYYK